MNWVPTILVCSAYVGIILFCTGFSLGRKYAESVGRERCGRCTQSRTE